MYEIEVLDRQMDVALDMRVDLMRKSMSLVLLFGVLQG